MAVCEENEAVCFQEMDNTYNGLTPQKLPYWHRLRDDPHGW